MQINNWSDLLANKRLSKTVRDENNDLIILGTNTKNGLKKQDTWQPYAMTVADLAAAIGGGGGGVSFALKAGSNIQLKEQIGAGEDKVKNGSFIPAENSVITIGAISIPNGLRWRGDFDSPTAGTTFEINDVVYTDLGSPSLYKTWFALQAQPVASAVAPPASGESNAYWAQLGVEGNPGVDGFRTAILTLYKWTPDSTVPTSSLPSGSSEYTWSSGVWDSPATLNGWSQDIPAPTGAGYYLYKISKIIINNNVAATDNITWTGTETPEYVSYAGADGINGSSGVANIRTVTASGSILAAGSPGTNLNDRGALILVESTTDVTISIPNNLNTNNSNGFPGKYQVSIMKIGTGKVTIDGTAVTMRSANNMNVLRTQYSAATLIRDASDTNIWYLFGDLTNIPA